MHIVLLEDDHFDMEYVVDEFKKIFRGLKVTPLHDVEQYLVSESSIQRPYILVLEHHLPLLSIGATEDNLKGRVLALNESFLWTNDWNHQDAAERLIRHIRTSDKDLQIIIYTHSDPSFIAPDVKKDPKVKTLPKRGDLRNLTDLVKQLTFNPVMSH